MIFWELGIVEKMVYFQYSKELGYPIFIKCNEEEMPSLFMDMVKELGFDKISSEDVQSLKFNNRGVNVLEVTMATPSVSQKIGKRSFIDNFGAESTTPKQDHLVYRHLGRALVIYSFKNSYWKMAITDDFSPGPELWRYRAVLNRFLSWTLSISGVVGIWGKFIEDDMVTMNQQQAQGNAIFVDIEKKKIFQGETIKNLVIGSEIFRVVNDSPSANKTLKKEELIGHLFHNCTYFDYRGVTKVLKNKLYILSKYFTCKTIHTCVTTQPKRV